MNVTFQAGPWEIVAVLAVGGTLAGMVIRRPALFWPFLIVVNMAGVGPPLMNYFFWDKALSACIVTGALLRLVVTQRPGNGSPQRDDQHVLFNLWLWYMIVQSIRGVIVNNDVRIVYWVFMYSLLALVAYIVYRRGDEFRFPPLTKFSRVALWTVVLYNVAYLTYGVITEQVLGIGAQGRFAAQFLMRDVFVWTGPSTAVFPTIVGMPAAVIALRANSARVRALAFIAVALMMAAAFFYAARAAWIVIFAVTAVSFRKIGLKRIGTVAAIFIVGFLVFAGETMVEFFDDLMQTTQLLWSPKDSDMNRQLQFEAGFLRLIDNPLTFLIGDGIYSHKSTIIPSIEHLYASYLPNEVFTVVGNELRDDSGMGLTVFRTTAFTALLVDTGVVGMLLLVVLFALSIRKVLSRKGPDTWLLITTLLLTFSWQFSSNLTGMVLFYLMFMPCGLVEQVSNGHRERQNQLAAPSGRPHPRRLPVQSSGWNAAGVNYELPLAPAASVKDR